MSESVLSAEEEQFVTRSTELWQDIFAEQTMSPQQRIGVACLCAAGFIGAASGAMNGLYEAQGGKLEITMDEWVRTIGKTICDMALKETTQ